MIIDYLRNKSRPFIFSTFLSPADMEAALAALRILKTEAPAYLRRLRENTDYVRSALTAAGLPVVPGMTPIIPVITGSASLAVKLEQRLYQEGILLSAIRPPTVAPGSSRLRITITAEHTRTQLQRLIVLLSKAWQDLVQHE